ncbi:MAG: hypothetical protein GXP55_24090 [Deltaproteobacteria bacterium]|nr:hypothetical protein [Deltaproteobacteria bacterium]
MTETGLQLAEELFEYVGFGPEDVAILRELGPLVEAHHDRIIEDVHAAILRHPAATAVFEDEAQIERQKASLRSWLSGAFSGEYGQEWFAARQRIGEAHTGVGFPQRYLFAGMNLVRAGVHRALADGAEDWSSARKRRAHLAIDRLLDVELAVILQTCHAAQSDRLRAAERFAALGQVVASIGHELRNPLAVMQTSVHILGRHASGDERSMRHIGRIRDQVMLCGQIISALLELARDRPAVRSATDLRLLGAEVFDSVPHPSSVDLVLELPDDFPLILLDGNQLRQLLVNLTQNAVAALENAEAGRVTLSARVDADVVEIEVRDTGPGVPEDALAHVFEPLFTRRQGGVGLGLALCRRIAEKHAGVLEVSNMEQGGARFVLRLPDAVAP